MTPTSHVLVWLLAQLFGAWDYHLRLLRKEQNPKERRMIAVMLIRTNRIPLKESTT